MMHLHNKSQILVVAISTMMVVSSLLALMPAMHKHAGTVGIDPYAVNGTDPSVYLHINGPGYIVLNTSYSGITFTNDKVKYANFSGVPTGTVFNITSDPNSGYYFAGWTGSVTSMKRSLNIAVNNNINEEAVYKKAVYYNVNFSETGLPTGTTWYLNISGGQSYTASSSLLSISELNGTYNYTVACSNSTFAPIIASGTFNVIGASLNESSKFSEVFYESTFAETGLPNGFQWDLHIASYNIAALAGQSISVNLTNGTYSYTIHIISSIYNYPGSLSVSGSNQNITVNLSRSPQGSEMFTAFFTEIGLPTNENWGIYILSGPGSGSYTTSSPNLDMLFANGTYPYYAFNYLNNERDYGNLTVDGATRALRRVSDTLCRSRKLGFRPGQLGMSTFPVASHLSRLHQAFPSMNLTGHISRILPPLTRSIFPPDMQTSQ